MLERVRGIELRYYIVAAHYRSHVEFSFEALEESAKAFRRLEDFLDRARSRRRLRGSPRCPTPSGEAMDDDLGTPAAVAVIHDSVREGNRLLADGPSDELSQKFGEVVAMLDVLGLNPADPAWAPRRLRRPADRGRRRAGEGTARGADGGARGQGLGSRRRHPRPDQGGRHGDRGHLDRPTSWTHRLGRRCDVMAGNSQRKGAIKKTGKGNPTAGSGGRVRRGLEGRGPTPKAKDRPYHQAHKAAKRAERDKTTRPKRRTTAEAEWAAGRNSVVELLQAGVPVTRGLRRRGRRARRPDARGVQARRRAGARPCSRSPATRWTG